MLQQDFKRLMEVRKELFAIKFKMDAQQELHDKLAEAGLDMLMKSPEERKQFKESLQKVQGQLTKSQKKHNELLSEFNSLTEGFGGNVPFSPYLDPDSDENALFMETIFDKKKEDKGMADKSSFTVSELDDIFGDEPKTANCKIRLFK